MAEIKTDDSDAVRSCEECGALVRGEDQDKHTAWHRRLDDFQRDIYDDIYRGSGE